MPKPPRKEKVAIMEATPIDKTEPMVQKLKCKGVNPILPKMKSKE